MKSYIYLASPYTALREDGTHDDVLMQERYMAVLDCYESLLSAGMKVYCPIVATHPADCLHRNLKGRRFTSAFWMEVEKPFLQYASQLLVLKLPGWEKSEGVTEEIKIAIGRKLPIVYLEFNPTRAISLEP